MKWIKIDKIGKKQAILRKNGFWKEATRVWRYVNTI